MFLIRSAEADGEDVMIKAFIEEAASLMSIALFVGMVAIWAQVFSTF